MDHHRALHLIEMFVTHLTEIVCGVCLHMYIAFHAFNRLILDALLDGPLLI